MNKYVVCCVIAVVINFAEGQTSTQQSNIRNGLPVVSPDGSRIAFISDRDGHEDLFVISADGTNETRLTNTADEENISGWTADSKQLCFSVEANDTSIVYLIDPDGKNKKILSRIPGRSPMISPDGKHFVYMTGSWTVMSLMVSAIDGSNARQINDGSSIAWNNHWSPDGKYIAFTGRKDSASGIAVFVMDANGSNRRQITQLSLEEGGAQWPVWSPDGRHLAFQVNSRMKKNAAHIWVVDVATGKAYKLGAHDQPYLDETPSWFPDGKHIAFQSNRTGRMEVWVMNVDGSSQRQVTGVQRW